MIGSEVFNSDGHPSFAPGGEWFVTDTYPDRFRVQTLNLYNLCSRRRYEIARLKTYRQFATLHPQRHWSCDLHPRMDRAGRYLCFDATYTGTRSLCTIDLGAPLEAHSKPGALAYHAPRDQPADS
jgi:hypothetical protein